MNVLLLESIPLLEKAIALRLYDCGHTVTTQPPVYTQLMDTMTCMQDYELLWMDTCIFSEGSSRILKTVRRNAPATKILLYGVNESITIIKHYYQQGSHCYLKKEASVSEMDIALSSIGRNEIYVSLSLTQQFSNWLCQDNTKKQTTMNLTPREQEVLKLIVEEYTTKEIAQKLFICPSTVETHRLKLIQKMGVKNTAGLVRIAVEQDLWH